MRKSPVKYFVIALLIVSASIILMLVLGVKVVKRGPTWISGDSFRPEDPFALPSVEGGTRESIIDKIETPGMEAAAAPNVAIPKNVLGSGAGQIRMFDIRAEGGRFTPDTIIVNESNVVDIYFTAGEKDYDIFFPDFGVYKLAHGGETVRLQFQAYPYGKYEFFCKDFCAEHVAGQLIVNQR